ncbi:hypothetical protein ACWD25_25860 [Streptomyces sp. NPDC002920]
MVSNERITGYGALSRGFGSDHLAFNFRFDFDPGPNAPPVVF